MIARTYQTEELFLTECWVNELVLRKRALKIFIGRSDKLREKLLTVQSAS